VLHIVEADWDAPARIRALCTTRLGGVSQGNYRGLNLGAHVGDEPGHVERNRELLSETLDLPSAPRWLAQTHSTRVSRLDGSGRYDADADAAVTVVPDTVAVVMTADCLPVLFCNRRGGEVAAAHAGWRGLADGILEATMMAMESAPGDLLAWIGPAIGQAHFEVGDEVRDRFVARQETAASRFEASRPGHWLCDLAGLAHDILLERGVSSVHPSGLCCYQDSERFYSYRREKLTGRMASLIWISAGA